MHGSNRFVSVGCFSQTPIITTRTAPDRLNTGYFKTDVLFSVLEGGVGVCQANVWDVSYLFR
jgi:hypothetical protein